MVKRGMLYAGWWGRPKSTDVLPFICKDLQDAIVIDFGSDEDTDQHQRYALFNLFHGAVRLGKGFVLTIDDIRHSLIVKDIVDLVSGEKVL